MEYNRADQRHVATFKAFVSGTKTDGKGDLVISLAIPRSSKWDAMPITDEGVLMLEFDVYAGFPLSPAVDQDARTQMLERMKQGLPENPWAGKLGDGTGHSGRGDDNQYAYGYKESADVTEGLVAQDQVRTTGRKQDK